MADSLNDLAFLAWADGQFPEFFEGDVVSYVGPLEEAHGLWVVEFCWDHPTALETERYQLKHYYNAHVKLNADGYDLINLYQTNQ